MSKAEIKEASQPVFRIDRSPMGIMLQGEGVDRIPHLDLIQATMNAAAIVTFDLNVSFATEGGIHGKYKDDYIDLTNWEERLGVCIEDWMFVELTDPLKEVLDFYDDFMASFFLSARPEDEEWHKAEAMLTVPTFRTTQAIWGRLVKVMLRLGPDDLAKKVMEYFSNETLGRRYLRGLTDEEIREIFVTPPTLMEEI